MRAAPPTADLGSRRRGRQGMTLIEIMVTIAVIAIVVGLAVPGLSAVLDLQRRDAARTLAETYTWLLDEAAMRNVSFRVVYHLDERTWQVEVGDPNTVVFSTPEDREKFEQQLKDDMKRYTQREIEEGAAAEVQARAGQFDTLDDTVFKTAQALPEGTVFSFVYTPQYGPHGVSPSAEMPEDPEDAAVAYTYIFSDGTAEHTLVRICDEEDPEDGFTVEVEPISGKVRLETDLTDPTQSMSWLPEAGPELQ